MRASFGNGPGATVQGWKQLKQLDVGTFAGLHCGLTRASSLAWGSVLVYVWALRERPASVGRVGISGLAQGLDFPVHRRRRGLAESS